MNLIAVARREYDEIAKLEVQRAFVYSFEEMAKNMCNAYLDNVEAYCNKDKIKDPITEDEMEPDERLMRSIEEQIGISDNAKNTFRQEILIRISSYSRKGKAYTVRRRVNKQFSRRQKGGRVVMDSASELGTRLVALWVRVIVETYRDAAEGKP